MRRREFLRNTGYGSAFVLSGAAGSFLASCRKKMEETAAPISVIEGPFTMGLSTFTPLSSGDLKAMSTRFMGFRPQAYTRCFGYHDYILGPTFQVNAGQNFSARLNNLLGDYTNIHWHGLIVPENMDGHPEQVVAPGGSYDYSFTLNQRAGTYWYHPHLHGTTAKQAYMGLAGFFIVNDAEEAALNLPSGFLDMPIAIQDKRVFPDLALDYSPDGDDIMNGYLGQYVLCNGTWSPVQQVQRRFYRLRLLNGSNARIYNIGFSDNSNFTIIGNDGGLLAAPAAANAALLSPGERLDILVDFANWSLGSSVYLVSKTFSGEFQGQQEFRILKFDVAADFSDTFSVPASLSSITPLLESNASRTRTFSLAMSGGHEHGSGMMSGMHRINDKVFDPSRIDETVAAGDTEIWVFDNTDGHEPHPMHIHGVQFQVLDRTGGRTYLLPSEGGWKDTVLVMPHEKVRVIMTFPNNPGKFVFHCHNLEHADDGMMLQYKIA